MNIEWWQGSGSKLGEQWSGIHYFKHCLVQVVEVKTYTIKVSPNLYTVYDHACSYFVLHRGFSVVQHAIKRFV